MGTSALSAETLMLAGIGMTYDTALKLKRVYSVWLFADGPQELRGSVWSTETSWCLREAPDTENGRSKSPRPCNLMNIVFGFMGGREEGGPAHADVIDLLNVLFEREKSNHSKRDILEREFSIVVTPGLEAGSMALDEINEGMVRMLERRLSEKWLAEGLTDGLEEGRQQGLAEGRAEGLAKGREAGLAEGREAGLAKGLEDGRRSALVSSIRSLEKKLGLAPEAAMDALGVSPTEREALMEQLARAQ